MAGVTSREVAPFSFQSLYALTRLKDEIPMESLRHGPLADRDLATAMKDLND